MLPARAVRGAPNQAGAAQLPLSTGAAGEASGSGGMGRPLGRLEGAKGKAAVASNVARRASSWGVSFVPPANVEELVQARVQERAAISKQGLAHTYPRNVPLGVGRHLCCSASCMAVTSILNAALNHP